MTAVGAAPHCLAGGRAVMNGRSDDGDDGRHSSGHTGLTGLVPQRQTCMEEGRDAMSERTQDLIQIGS